MSEEEPVTDRIADKPATDDSKVDWLAELRKTAPAAASQAAY